MGKWDLFSALLGGSRAALIAPGDYNGHSAEGEPHQEDDGYEDDCFDQFGHDGLPPFRAASVTASCVFGPALAGARRPHDRCTAADRSASRWRPVATTGFLVR